MGIEGFLSYLKTSRKWTLFNAVKIIFNVYLDINLLFKPGSLKWYLPVGSPDCKSVQIFLQEQYMQDAYRPIKI
jgi:hypothetical protein